jgi:hypothetical protein
LFLTWRMRVLTARPSLIRRHQQIFGACTRYVCWLLRTLQLEYIPRLVKGGFGRPCVTNTIVVHIKSLDFCGRYSLMAMKLGFARRTTTKRQYWNRAQFVARCPVNVMSLSCSQNLSAFEVINRFLSSGQGVQDLVGFALPCGIAVPRRNESVFSCVVNFDFSST